MSSNPANAINEVEVPPKRSFARYAAHAGRILMGLLFVLTGLNGFLDFLPKPPTMPEFVTALINTHYMLPLIAGTQLLAGLLLVANRFVPFAVVLIAPVVVNIVAFHLFVDRSGMGIGIIVLAIELFLIWSYRKVYRPMLAARAIPGAQ